MNNQHARMQLASAILLLGFTSGVFAQSDGRDPFAKSPAAAYKDPYPSTKKQCPNFRHVGIRVLESAAAHAGCAVAHMLPVGGRITSPSEKARFDGQEPFNAACGASLRAAERRGEYRLSSTVHRIEIVVVEGWNERLVFSGTVTGDRLSAEDESRQLISGDRRAVTIPDIYTSGVVVTRFVNPGEIRTPAPSGVGVPIEDLQRGCKLAGVLAIEADAP